jgi:hypothetical protein
MAEVVQIEAHGLQAAIDEMVGEVESVKWLVPEFALGLRARDPIASARQRR